MSSTTSAYTALAAWSPRLLSVLRIMAALLYLAHGTQKLLGFPPMPGGRPMPDLLTLQGASGVLELVLGTLLALGIAVYLGTHLGAGPIEGAALAWDPPVPFWWSYSVVQGGGALAGWLLGATIGPGTLAVIFLLGPAVDLTSRILRLDVHQELGRAPATKQRGPATTM